MLELTNRETASVILILAFVGVFALVPKLRRQVGSSVIDALKSFFVWRIQLSLALYFLYGFAVVHLAWQFGAWQLSLLQDTLIVVTITSLPLLFSAHQIRDGTKFLRKVARKTVGVAALVAFYVNLGSLPLWGELLLQPLVIFLSLLAVVAHQRPEHRPVETFADGLLAIIGLSLVAYTTRLVFSTWDGRTVAEALGTLWLCIWLPLALIPFIYLFAFIIHCESILTMLPFVNEQRQPPLRVRLAGIWGLHLRTRLASDLTGHWRRNLTQSNNWREALGTMREFRRAVRRRDAAVKKYGEGLEQLAGAGGIDDSGLRRDRREFAATKRELTNLYFMQMGWYRNQGSRYRADLLDILGDLTNKGLPAEHGIRMNVQRGGQAWRAWRQTPSGWHFGVGGTRELQYQWRYDGPSPPSGYPSAKNGGWVNTTLRHDSPEWLHDDEPPSRID